MKNLVGKITFFLIPLVIAISLNAKKADAFCFFNFFCTSRTPTYKLNYFNIHGRAEFIRWMFVVSNTRYTDNRISQEQWPNYRLTTPFGQLPTLEVTINGQTTTLAQASAIGSYLGNALRLSGSNDLQKSLIDMYGQQANDLFGAVSGPGFIANATQRLTQVDRLIGERWVGFLNTFETRLRNTGTGFLVGNSMSWADLYLVHNLIYLYERKQQVLANYPNITRLDNAIRSNSRIAAWLASRPQSIL